MVVYEVPSLSWSLEILTVTKRFHQISQGWVLSSKNWSPLFPPKGEGKGVSTWLTLGFLWESRNLNFGDPKGFRGKRFLPGENFGDIGEKYGSKIKGRHCVARSGDRWEV